MEKYMKRNLYIFDLDGTLANIDHRAHFVRNGRRQWKEFFEACDKDEPVMDVIEVFLELRKNNDVRIWSGRSASVREKTLAWLDKHIPNGSFHLQHMRPENDYQSDVELKRSWLKAEQIRPTMIFDDRQQVVDMWREEGITCAQVAPWNEDKPASKNKAKLTVMVGPSGSGKSTLIYAKGLADHAFVVSSDEIRKMLFTTKSGYDPTLAYTPEGFTKTWAAFHAIAKQYLEHGINVIADSTNIKRADRINLLQSVGAYENPNISVEYRIVERPLDNKLVSYKINGGWHTNEAVIIKHHDTWESSKSHAYHGDDLPFVNVIMENVS
jgi:predicted kinase